MKPFGTNWKFRQAYCEECHELTKHWLDSSDYLTCNQCCPRASPQKRKIINAF